MLDLSTGVSRIPFQIYRLHRILTIKSVSNGFRVILDDDEGQNEYVVEELESRCRTFTDLLNIVDDELGPMSSRHDAERVRICYFPGDKHEDFDTAECPVCYRGPEHEDNSTQ